MYNSVAHRFYVFFPSIAFKASRIVEQERLLWNLFQTSVLNWCVNYNSLHDICCFTIVIIESSVGATLLSLHNFINSASVTLLSHTRHETLVARTACPWRPMITFRRYKFCCRRWHQQTRFYGCKKFIIEERSASDPCKKCHDQLIVSIKRHSRSLWSIQRLGT